MSQLALVALDLLAVNILVFVLYWRRHRRRDLVVAYLGVNVGVLAVSAALASASVGAGLGLGLFGVLSIIRLRSDEISQHEIAYYFAALALGLIGGLPVATPWFSAAGMVLIVGVLAIADHPRMLRGHTEQTVVLDRAIADPEDLRCHLSDVLGAEVHSVSVERLDLVNDTTLVRARFRRSVAGTPSSARPAGAARQVSQEGSHGLGEDVAAGARR